MIFSRAIIGLLVAAARIVAQSSNTTDDKPFALASPDRLTQCKNTTIVWQGGKAPFRVTLKPACESGQVGSEEEHIVSTPGSTSLKLPIKYAAGTQLIVSISDASNMQASAPLTTVVSGNADDSCSVQTACSHNIQAPNAPVALVSGSSGAAAPTDHLVTADPSATSTPTAPPTSSSASVIILYSYVPAPTPSKGPGTVAPESNAALPGTSISSFTMLGFAIAVGFQLTFV